MTPDRQRIDKLFAQALDLPPEARAQFLADACGDDQALRAEVQSLLDHDARAATDFMRVPPSAPQAELVPMQSGARADNGDPSRDREGADLLAGTRIGKYTIVRTIASGGMGTVYEAEQDNPRRTVALKVMHAWDGSPSARRRFEYEAQFLAHLRHPNITQVYEADIWGQEPDRSSRPFFVMEFVPDARPITRYARECALSLHERVGLFLQVCEAVQHGHQKGVVHRDLKPGNILVDAAGQPKIIDFGVAKATDADIAVTTLRTDVGQLVGTIQYMSPEQCADPLNLDARTDVYSLGIVLYELLCDRLPYDVSSLPIPSAARAICETPPERPSTIHRALRGDLEIILLKALEKDRQKRYQSATDLARDLRHYLAREPIEARGPSLASTAFRLTRKHPIFTTAVAAATVGITILATVISTVYVAHLRPYRIALVADKEHQGKDAVLLSLSGNPLFTWSSPAHDGIVAAKLLRDPTRSRRKLAVIAFASTHPGPLRGKLCFFDADHPSQDGPVRMNSIEAMNIPADASDGFAPANFEADNLWVAEVFAESEGEELIATFRHPRSRRAIRIISATGETLYQVWHDGGILGARWLERPKLLVLSGEDQTHDWKDRDYPGAEAVAHNGQHVIFALHPQFGYVSRECVSTASHDPLLRPVWHRCLLPPHASDDFSCIRMVRNVTFREFEDGEHIEIVAESRRDPAALVSWVLDKTGKALPGKHVLSEAYRRDPTLPDPGEYSFGDLPPARSPYDQPSRK